MKPLDKYAAFVARFPAARSDDFQIAHSILPPSFGGTRSLANTVYVDARAALHACALLWRMAPNERVRRRYATNLLARLNAPEMRALGGRTAWLLRAIRPYASGAASANSSDRVCTLWCVDGRVATGTQSALTEITGLESRRVRDLVCGRRVYAQGWATSPEAAAGGRRKRGRPVQEKDFWAA